jgi:transcriptional regulator with XRE-family HTH domain
MGTKDLRPKRLGEKLKEIRVNLNLSQSELIEKMGFSDVVFQGNISQYELGRREPPLPVLLAYAQIANIYVDILINDDLEVPENLPASRKKSFY